MNRKPRRSSKSKRVLRSGYEDRIAKNLKDRKVPFKYEAKTFSIVVPVATRGMRCEKCGHNKALRTTTYTPDFFLGNGVVVEAKGRLTAENRRIYAAFVEQHPSVDFRMVFQRNNPIRKGSKTKYSDWCNKHCILYCIGEELPDEWTLPEE